MAKTSALDTLINLATDDRDAAAVALGRLRQDHQQTEQKLEALLGYHAEYQRRLDEAMSMGMSIATLQNYQRFIASLEHAIEQQRGAVNQSERRIEHGHDDWRTRQKRLNSYDVLAVRRREAAQKAEARREQRQTDEFASRALSAGLYQ